MFVESRQPQQSTTCKQENDGELPKQSKSSLHLERLMQSSADLLSHDVLADLYQDCTAEVAAKLDGDRVSSHHMAFMGHLVAGDYGQASQAFCQMLTARMPASPLAYTRDAPMTVDNVCLLLTDDAVLNGVGWLVADVIDAARGNVATVSNDGQMCGNAEKVVVEEESQSEEMIGEKMVMRYKVVSEEEEIRNEEMIGQKMAGGLELPSIFGVFQKLGLQTHYYRTHKQVLYIKLDVGFFDMEMMLNLYLIHSPEQSTDVQRFNLVDLRDLINEILVERCHILKIPEYTFLALDSSSRRPEVICQTKTPLQEIFQSNNISLCLAYVIGDAKNKSWVEEGRGFEVVQVTDTFKRLPVYFVIANGYKAVFYSSLLDLVQCRYRIKDEFINPKSKQAMELKLANMRNNEFEEQHRLKLGKIADAVSEYLLDTEPRYIMRFEVEYPPRDQIYTQLLGESVINSINGFKLEDKMVAHFYTSHNESGNLGASEIDTSALLPHDGSSLHQIRKSSVNFCSKLTIRSRDETLVLTTIMIKLAANSD